MELSVRVEKSPGGLVCVPPPESKLPENHSKAPLPSSTTHTAAGGNDLLEPADRPAGPEGRKSSIFGGVFRRRSEDEED